MTSLPQIPAIATGKRKSSPVEIGSSSDADSFDIPAARPAKKAKKMKNSERPVTEAQNYGKKLPTKCGCKTGCKGSCACVKNGLGCGPSCKCATCADAKGKCTNKLNEVFGALGWDGKEQMQAEPCFLSFASTSKQPISVPKLAEALQRRDDAFEFDPWLEAWLETKHGLREGGGGEEEARGEVAPVRAGEGSEL
ncbi:hypothetical protein CkaCkLH20_11208 [Colletotrichum karsti]|uniref:Tesmin/TSO1-like CXC domain-containing protein n=1 Tax=Colletotrichum karsti TaxID=1095194 RepID=A0A9P6HUH5_9PEZI|nr:uncharacterized protein CkaCkLH20_11208 [Colletotrichum karsti]KAF9871287.1 hypothetical protein CkaCkLH20_11208 [Colletotrichum karsti]